jgi:hypothetical protein
MASASCSLLVFKTGGFVGLFKIKIIQLIGVGEMVSLEHQNSNA